MYGYIWIIYFLLIILFLLCFYFIRKKNWVLEEGLLVKSFEERLDKSLEENIYIQPSSSVNKPSVSGLDVMNQTVFGKNVDNLKLANNNLELYLDKINKTYTDLTNQKFQVKINEGKIEELTDNVNKVNKDIDNAYLKITNSVQPIMFLKLTEGQFIRNDAISYGIIDYRIQNILYKTEYNIIKNQNATLGSYNNKNCLILTGEPSKSVRFSVIPTITQFSFSFWVYNATNMEPVISIMCNDDFNKKEPNSGLKIYIKSNIVEVHYKGSTLMSDTMNIGWNHITFTTGDSTCIYINGSNMKCNTIKAAPIQPLPMSYDTLYKFNTFFIIGGTTFQGHVYNVRYYAIEIPSKVVSEVYKLDKL